MYYIITVLARVEHDEQADSGNTHDTYLRGIRMGVTRPEASCAASASALRGCCSASFGAIARPRARGGLI